MWQTECCRNGYRIRRINQFKCLNMNLHYLSGHTKRPLCLRQPYAEEFLEDMRTYSFAFLFVYVSVHLKSFSISVCIAHLVFFFLFRIGISSSVRVRVTLVFLNISRPSLNLSENFL